MSLVTRAEWAEICKTNAATVNTNIARGKITVLKSDKRMLDTENPLNKIFKKNQIAIANKKLADERAEKKNQKASGFEEAIKKAAEDLNLDEDELDEIYSKPETPKQKKAREQQNEDDDQSTSWDLMKKKADALKATEQAKLATLQVEKLMGNLMPVDLVEGILRTNIQHIFKEFENELINIASIYCDILASGDRGKLSEIIAKIRAKLNETINRTKTNSAKEIENVIEDYAETRNRGEKK